MVADWLEQVGHGSQLVRVLVSNKHMILIHAHTHNKQSNYNYSITNAGAEVQKT